MTSTNDGKDVKSNQISGPKSKTYFIELYKSLDARLSGECSAEERTRLVCQSWRRVHSLCQHSAPTTQLHLINWLQQHTAHTILQTEWQSPKSKEQHTWLERAIDEFIQECRDAISKRDGGWSPPWEHQLQLRALWFKSTLPNPWGHGVLKALLDLKGPKPSDDEVLEWLMLERGVMFVTRLRQLAASKCDDLALLLATAVMDKMRAATVIVSDVEQAEAKGNPELLTNKESAFVNSLREGAGFTEEVWMLITDIEFVLLYKGELRSRCIELAKQTPLLNGYQLVKRLHTRLEKSPRDKKLWKNAKEAATLVAQVVIARCMVVPRCWGAARGALAGCAGLLALMLAPERLRTAAAALAAPAATSRHLYTLAEAVHDRCKDERTPFVCELYVRAITAGMNELERLKIKTEKESEARATEKTLSSWFSKLGGLLSGSRRLYCECILTAFSVHPSPAMYERVQAAPALAPLKTDIQETNEEANSEYGSWATDSRTQTNLVKTSETLNLKKTQKQANVLSTAIFAEGEALGLGAELCQDLAVLISGPRIKTLSWDTDRGALLESCAVYCERTRGGTRALTTELRFLNLDPRCFQHLPEERDDDGDLYYGIEKGYEHLVDLQEPEEIWQDAASDDGDKSDGAAMDSPLAVLRRKQHKTKPLKYSSDEEPLSLEAIAKSSQKKERPHSKERSRERKDKKHKAKVKQEPKDEGGEIDQGSEKQKKKKERKERKKKEKDKDTPQTPVARPSGSLSRLVGMKVAGLSSLNSAPERRADGTVCVTDSDYDSQGKSSIASLNSEGNDPDVLFDGLFSMEETKSPEKNVNDNIQRANVNKMEELSLSTATKYQKSQSPNYQTPLLSSNVSHVKEEVKNSIKKLIEFRRYKNITDDPSTRTLNTQRIIYDQQQQQQSPHNKTPVTIINTHTPKVLIHKEQIKQLHVFKDEFNNILQSTSLGKDSNGVNEAAERSLPPNTITKRPNEKAKISGYKSSASRKIEQPLQLHESMSVANPRELLEKDKRAAESSQYKQEIIKHLEKGPSKMVFPDILKALPCNRADQPLQKSETVIHNMYQSGPQHVSNASPVSLHAKVASTNRGVSQSPHHQHHRLVVHKHDPGQRQFHNFLKDLQVSINAGATNDKQDRKTFPAQTNSKQTLQQKKPDNVPNTFARMSYLKNKQTDFKLKSTEKTMQNKSVHVAPIENLQHLHSKGGIFISKIDKTKHPTSIERDKIKLENRENKLKVKKETIDAMNSHKISTPLSIVKKHPTMSNILSSGSEKHVPNTSSVSNLKCFETMQPEAPEQTSFLSEKDQDDMLQLLRQQSLLNSMKGQHKTHIQKSSTDSVTILNNKTPSIVNPIRRPSVSASNIKINKPTSEPKCSNEKPLPNSTLKISNTKPTSASHSKKRNIKETTKNSKDASKQSDWESVMNALLATKTPSRVSQSGPNALDIALDKDSFDRCYSSNAMSQTQRKINSSVITETTKSNSAISTQKPICDITETAAAKGGENCEIKSKDREYASSSKSQTITRLLKVSKPVLKPKPIFIENHLDLAKRHTFQGPGKPLPSVIQNRNDPFISGIKNSDYDLLEELMDDDLRQEIGELSDEEPYDASPPNMTKKNNPALNKSLYVQQQRPIEPFDHTYKLTDLNYKDSVRCQNVLKPMVHGKKCTLSKSNSDVKLRITSNEVISSGNINNNVNYFPVINDTGATVRNSNEVKNNLNLTPKKTNVYTQQQNNKISPIVVDPDSSVKIDDQTTNININKVQNSHLNILDPTRVVLTVPPRNAQPNVMLIDNDFIYDSLSTVNLEQNVNGAASNYNHNTYIAVNQVPKVTVYRTTQFATSIRSPVLIEKSIVFPASKNDNNVAAEVAQLTSSSIVHGEISDSLISPNKLKTDRRNDVPGREQTFSKFGNELLSEPTNIKLTNKDDANQRTSVCNILLNDNSPEIFQKTQEHNTSSTDKKNCSISHIPTSVIVSSDNYGTINSSHLGSKIDNEKPSMCPQNTIRDSPPQKDKIVKEDSTNTDTPIVFHLKDIQSSDIKVSQIENVNKQNTSANQHHSRTYLKRLRILNREIEHRCRVEPIVLSYEPIKSKQNEEVNSDKVESPLLGPSIAAPKNLELAKSTCRRILLRSSNSLNVTKSLSKGKSKFIDVRMGQARVKHKSTPYSKQCNDEFQKNDAAHLTETSNTKKEYIRSPQPISEGVVKSIDDIKDTEKLNVLNDKNENNIDSCNTSSVAENMETSVTPVVKINESKLPLQKEIAGCDTQDKQSNYITEYNASDTPEKKELQTSTEDMTEVDTNTLNGQSEEIKSISMQYQISTNNNNIIKCVSGTSTSDQNQNIKDEFNEKIFFEELPNLSNDKSKRYIRIKLRNDSFKASISGKVNVNIDAILEDPSIKSMLMEKMNCNTKCILNIKQIAVPSKNRPSVIKTPIQDVSYVVKDDLETINLISDDDEDLTQNFETEFGIFKIATMNPNLFTKHQNKFSQRCEVRIESSKLKKNKVSHTVEENVTNSTTSVENICVTSLEIPKNIVDYIEIDDSSNESISLMSNLDCALVNNSLGETKLNDLVTNNISQNITESEPHLVNSKIPQTCESSQNMSEVEIKDCSLKIEKCDKLIKQYEQLKIKNKKCFVNLVRCDSSQHYRMKTEEVSDLKSTEELNQLSDILHADEEISETCEQSLKRVDSVSILNDLLIFEEEGSSVPVHPSSPVPSVIESDMYTTSTANADTFSENNSVIDFLPLHCFADWMMTKSKSRVMEPESNECKLMPFGLEKTHVIADDISTDCDSDRESNSASDKIYYEKGNYEKERDIFHAPSLVKIIVDFFANNIHIIESLKPTQTSCKFQNVLLTRSLKRKLNDFKGNRNYNKISKLENKSTVLDSDKTKELVIRPEYESVKNKPESLKNICGLYYVKIFNRYKVKSAAPAMNCNKQDEHHENKNESNLLTCDITEQNITTKALGTFEPIESVIGKAFEEKRSNNDENKYMNMLDCDIEQNENVGCVNLSMVQEMDLDITKPLANAASGFKCQDGGINNSKSDNTCIELQITSQHIEKDIQKLNYAIEAKNTLDYCYAKKDENIKLFGRNKILTSEAFISNKTILKENPDKECMLEIPINRLISPIKDDFSYNIEMDKKNVATSDVIVNKNDERKVDVPSQKLSSDHSSEALIHSNIKLQINKNSFESNSNINDDQLNIEKESTTSLTVATTEYFSRRNSEEIYNLSHNAKLEEDNIDNQLNIDIKLYNSLPPQNHNRLCNTHNDESVILTVDIKQKEADSSDDFIHSDKVITNSKENHQKLDININYPCSTENSNLLYSIRENAINIKSLDFENEQIKENEVELAKSLEKTETEIIEPSSAECNDKLKENLSVTMPLEDLEQINNLNGNKLMVDKIVSSPCSSQVYDICNKEGYNDSDCPDLIIPQFKSDEAEKVIPPEEIIDPSSYDNKLDKTNYDQRETTVEINHACIYNKDKISPEESLISFEIKPVPPLEKTDIMNIKNVEKISIPESVGNKCDINVSNSLEKVNIKSDTNDSELETYEDIENKTNVENDYVSNKLIQNNRTVSIKLNNEKNRNNSLTSENNNIVDKKEPLSKIADLGVETNNENNILQNENSCLTEINKIDLNQKHIFDVLHKISKEKVVCNKHVKYENNIVSEKPKQKNVTLLYKGESRVELEGSIYEDPVVGTCYVFPILNNAFLPEDILNNVSNDKSTGVLQRFKSKIMKDKEDNKIDDKWVNFNALPKITYLKRRLKQGDINEQNLKQKKRNLKRKIDFTDTKQHAKKYRKGKNIDYSKLTSINDSAYTKEYKRLFDYYNSITFSYSRPFHIEHIDVSNLLKSWPIRGITVDNTDQTDFKNLLFIDEDIYKDPHDPLHQTFSEEISNCNNQQYTCSNIIENNFSMGFGEGSDRVIHVSKNEDNILKFSAATLSDVKQAQPFLMSNHYEAKMGRTQKGEPHKEQKEVFKRYLNYIQLKEKVRTFFQNTTVELNESWLTDNKIKSNKYNINNRFPYELTCPDYIRPVPFQCVVQVVQVGQLPVSAAQNPVTCDPRVTQVTDASPSQCSGENSPHDSQSPIKTEYTELTTADISLPLVQEYERHIEAQESSKVLASLDNIPVETEIKTEIKDEISDFENDQNDCNENNVLQTLVNKHINNIEYPYESTDCTETLHTQKNSETQYEQEIYNDSDFIPDQKQHSSTPEKTDQIAHAMNAAGITTTSDAVSNSRTLVNVMSPNIAHEIARNDPPSPNNISKATINSMTLQQALAQILPPPLNPTSQENNQSSTNPSLSSQVLHIVQGKNSNSNQMTLVDNSQNSVISNSNTPMLHIVQNKGSHTNSTSNTNAGQHTNAFGGLSLVDSSLQGNSQLLHIVNTGSQKNSTSGQLLKRVNLLTNLTNTQGSNEQKMVQFVCKSADGKSIQLNSPHQRSMVLRLQPIESNIQNSPKPTDCQELSPVTNGNNSSPIKEGPHTQHEIKSRSVYEENYAKFIQSSNKSAPEKSTTLPKFNQAFGKQVFQDNNQKANDLNSNNSHLSINSSESSECQGTDNAINIDHIGQISSPPLLLRKSPAQASQTQSNLVQQIKQTIAPMNIQTMHGGVIYTRQIPVNIGGGQTINLITVPSTELLDNDNQKPSGEVKFINQSDTEPPIIKIVPHTQNNSSGEGSTEESNSHAGTTNENGQSTPTQHQPVLTQMRIKLPMLSKTPQMVSGTRVARPSFFQIQRNVIGGANQPVYQQLVLTAAPPLSQHIRLPQAQTTRQVKVSSDGQSSSESQMSTSTLEQLREFDMVLEQVKERSTVQPNTIPNNAFAKLHESSLDTTDGSSVTSTVTESTQQVLYSIGNNQSLNVAYVNRKPNPTFVRSPDSSGIIDSPSSSTHIQIPHTVTSESTSNDVSTQPSQPKAAKIGSKSKSRPKSSSNSSNSMKMNAVPPKTSTQKPLEDEQTTQRILYILAEYKEQVENSPDKDKPAPRRRSNPPSNPGSSKRKKSSSGSRRSGMRDMSPVHGEDTCRTMGSEDSSCGTSQGDCNDSCMDSHSPQDSPRKVVRKLTFDSEATTASQPRPQPQRNVIVADGQTITVARGTSGKPTTAVLMPANYILPVSMVKGGQQIAIVTNRGPKILTVGGGEGGTTNALLLQRLIGPAGLKPVLARPGVRHVRLPTAALHNLQTFNLATATFQPPDSTASPAAGSTPPELIETRANSSPWTDRDSQEVKPERGSSPEDAEPWNLPSSADPHDYSYEETVRTDNMDRTVLVVQRRDARPHRFAHVTHAAAMRHKYAILEHELRLQGSIFSQKSLSEECEDLGVDSPSASELFPEAELLFGNSPAHDAQQHSHTPQPTVLSQCGIPQPDIDDQIATDHLLQHDALDDQQDLGVTLGLDEGIVTVSEDGMQATIALDQEEFARSHPNTTFHSEPTEDGEIQPFIMAGLKGRHITSTVFHATRAPATVLVSAPPASGPAPPRPSPADLVLTDTRELHLSGHATQVIRRVCWDRRDSKFSVDEPGAAGAGDEAKMAAEDSSRDAAPESPPADDGASSPERHAELFWESNSTSERSEGRRPLDFSSDSEKCCKSPSYDETNSTDSGGVGAHVRLDSVIKDARGVEAGGSADGSSAEDAQPPVRTYPPKRAHRAHDAHDADERSVTGKTRAGERAVRRRASGRGVVKRACQCCGGDPAPLRTKKARQRKSVADFAPH